MQHPVMSTAAPSAVAAPVRILIVDDERQNRQLLEVMLAPEGFVLMTASSGEEALAMVAREPPDVILLDVMMPGLDGCQVVARLKGVRETRDIPVIMVTALDNLSAKMRGLSAGAEEYLTKPVNRAELVVRVKNLSRLKVAGDEKSDFRTADLVSRSRTLEQQAAVQAEQAALLDLMPDAIFVHDMDDRIVFWSLGAEVLYGWTSREAVGQRAGDLLRAECSESAEQVEETMQRRGLWEGEAVHHTRDGTPVTVCSRCALRRDSAGVTVGVLTTNNDITDRKAAESQLRLLTERLSLATAVAKIGVWEWDLASAKLHWDATMFDIYRLPPQTLPIPYDRWTSAVHPADLPAVEATLRSVIAEKGEGSSEYRITAADGSARKISTTLRAVLDREANVDRVIGVDMDITDRRAAEAVLEQVRQDQLRFKDEFLSHVSHELRSPLTAIKQFSMILVKGLAGELNAEQREYQEIVLRNIGQLQSMIDDLVEVTRLESGKLTVEPESISVASAVTDAFNTLQGTALAKGVSLTSDLPADLPPAYADPTRLRQILINLLDNAVKFTPEGGGGVHVRVRRLPDDPQRLQFEVSDTGCGISAGLGERLFERLYQASDHIQTSRKGLGLGLYICKELVTRQGGTIQGSRGTEGGSVFSFTLPVSSLTASLAPLLKGREWPATSVALVRVETTLEHPWPSVTALEEWSRQARSVLQRCVLPDLDVVLPMSRPSGQTECFYVVAFADEKGVSVLVNRLRGQFGLVSLPKQVELTVTVSYCMLNAVMSGDATRDGILADLARQLEEAMVTPTTQSGCPSWIA